MCNSSANYLFEIFSFLIRLPEAELSVSEAEFLYWYLSYFGCLAILNALSHNILSETALAVRSLQSP